MARADSFDDTGSNCDMALLTDTETSASLTMPEDQRGGDLILQGYGHKMSSGLFAKWERKYFILYPNRIEWGDSAKTMSKGHILFFHAPPLLVEEKIVKEATSIKMQHIGNAKEYLVRFEDHEDWLARIRDSVHKSNSLCRTGPSLLKHDVTALSISASVSPRRRTPTNQGSEVDLTPTDPGGGTTGRDSTSS